MFNLPEDWAHFAYSHFPTIDLCKVVLASFNTPVITTKWLCPADLRYATEVAGPDRSSYNHNDLKHVAAAAFTPFMATGDSLMDVHVAIVVGFMCKSHQIVLIKILM